MATYLRTIPLYGLYEVFIVRTSKYHRPAMSGSGNNFSLAQKKNNASVTPPTTVAIMLGIKMSKFIQLSTDFLKLTPSSVDAGRYLLNSDNALNFDIKMTFGNELRCQRSTATFCYILCSGSTSNLSLRHTLII